MTSSTLPPVLFLDVDGVIAPSGGEPSYGGPVRWANLLPGRKHFPAAVLDRVVELDVRGVVRVEWLTSWEGDAATNLAPALGLPVWPVHTRGGAPKWWECPVDTDWWKQRVVFGALEKGARVVWCDDDIVFRADLGLLGRLYGDRLLAVSADSGTGLTWDDLDRIEEWATDPV